MATLKHPGKYDCLKELGDDEPYFLLRAKGQTSAGLVRIWAHVHAGNNKLAMRELEQLIKLKSHIDCPVDKVGEAFACANSMDAWRKGAAQDAAPPPPEVQPQPTEVKPQEVKPQEVDPNDNEQGPSQNDQANMSQVRAPGAPPPSGLTTDDGKSQQLGGPLESPEQT